MDANNTGNVVLNLAQILELTGLPPRFQLVADGLDASADLYRRVVLRLAGAHLGQVGLALLETGPDAYQVILRPGNEWREVAYNLAVAANAAADRLIINDVDELLRRDLATGQTRDYPGYQEAVEGHLYLLRPPDPEPGRQGVGAKALRAALEAALEVEKVRRVA